MAYPFRTRHVAACWTSCPSSASSLVEEESWNLKKGIAKCDCEILMEGEMQDVASRPHRGSKHQSAQNLTTSWSFGGLLIHSGISNKMKKTLQRKINANSKGKATEGACKVTPSSCHHGRRNITTERRLDQQTKARTLRNEPASYEEHVVVAKEKLDGNPTFCYEGYTKVKLSYCR